MGERLFSLRPDVDIIVQLYISSHIIIRVFPSYVSKEEAHLSNAHLGEFRRRASILSCL